MSSKTDRAYMDLLKEADERCLVLVNDLTELALLLEPPEPAATDTVRDIEYRMGLSPIFAGALAARHEIEGCRTEIVLARIRRPQPA